MSGTWQRIDLGGKPADVYEPAGAHRPSFAVLFLHPLREETLADHPAYTGRFDELGLACVCPHAPRTWWADRLLPDFDPALTAERYLLDVVLPFFATRWGLQPPAIGLLGVSMGGQGALRLAFKHPRTFPVVAAIAPLLDHHDWYGRGTSLDVLYDSKEQCRQDSALLHVDPGHFPPHLFFCVDPADERWCRGSDRLHEKLAALGVPHECDLTISGGAHTWDYFDRMAERSMRFLHRGLLERSRRLL